MIIKKDELDSEPEMSESEVDEIISEKDAPVENTETQPEIEVAMLDDRSKDEKKQDEQDLYNINNFTL